jgi:membrane protein
MKQFFFLRTKEIVGACQETLSEWNADKAPRLGASLAFYTLLSLAPLLVVVLAIAALAYGRQAAQGQLVWQIQGLMGPDGARAVQALIQGAYKPGAGAIATIIGVVTLALGASSVVVELRDALNTIWHVPVDQGCVGLASIMRLVRDRFYSFAMVLAVGFLLLVSLILNTWIAAMGKFVGAMLPIPESALHLATFLISFIVITFLFAAIYKWLPDVQLRWSDVIVGACVTSLLFSTGKQLISLYLGKASFASTYGAAGSLVLLLVWVYYSAQLFFLGAEFTKVYTRTFGSQFSRKLQPTPPQPESILVDPSTKRPIGSDDRDRKIELIS